MRLMVKLLVALVLCGPAFATTPDALRDLVTAGDAAAVEAALDDALAQDRQSGNEPDLQLGLFAVFEVTDPAVDTFTADWLAQAPGSPNAMTARGWYLYAFGQAMRATEYEGSVQPAALEETLTYHTRALGLFDAALVANPDLVAAANGSLQLTATLGSVDITPAALIDIMRVRPNRGSLMRAMAAIPSYWDGKGDQITELCKVYAPKITSVPDYDVETCLVDAIYSKGFQKTDKRDAAHELLALTLHPILDYARLIDILDHYGTPTERLSALQKLQSTRQLTPSEAAALDEAAGEVSGGPGVTNVEYIKSLAPDLAARKLRVARDPFNPAEVNGYIRALQVAQNQINAPFAQDEVTQLLHRLLTKIPYSAEAWLTLANRVRGDPLDPNDRLVRIEAADPFYTNAVAYSDGNHGVLEAAMEAKGWAVANPENPDLEADISTLPVAELERMDRTFNCPFASTYRLLAQSCRSGDQSKDCGVTHPAHRAIEARIMSLYNRDACHKEIYASAPVPVPPPVKIALLPSDVAPAPAATPAVPITIAPRDALRERVMAGDIAAVDAALAKAAAQDEASGQDPETQRDLFSVFSATHPGIDRFTAKWVQQSPGSAAAMTARAWYLYTMGSAYRGPDAMRLTYPDGIETMQALHGQAFALFEAAIKADPGLLAASDGVLVLAATVGGDAVIPRELERIMALRPNRGSLMRAMFPLSPQWGGKPEQVRLLCDRYAPMITTIKDYSPDVCGVDAVFFAKFMPGKMRNDAYQRLAELQNPVLDYARRIAAFDRVGPATQRLAIFDQIKTERVLTPKEAIEWRIAFNEVNGLQPAAADLAYLSALLTNVDTLRLAADRDPLDVIAVTDYISGMKQISSATNRAYDKGDVIQRLQTLLKTNPHSWRAWTALANEEMDYATGNLEATAPYFQNAIYYSNYGLGALLDALSGKSSLIDVRSKLKATSGNLNQTPEDIAELDSIGICPLVALVRIADAVCAERGTDLESCLRNSNWWLIKPMLDSAQSRGACQTEATAPLGSLLQGPVPADF